MAQQPGSDVDVPARRRSEAVRSLWRSPPERRPRFSRTSVGSQRPPAIRDTRKNIQVQAGAPLFAANSVKVVPLSGTRHGHSIWVEPPWTVDGSARTLHALFRCSDTNKAGRLYAERLWVEPVRPFREAKLRLPAVANRNNMRARIVSSEAWRIHPIVWFVTRIAPIPSVFAFFVSASPAVAPPGCDEVSALKGANSIGPK